MLVLLICWSTLLRLHHATCPATPWPCKTTFYQDDFKGTINQGWVYQTPWKTTKALCKRSPLLGAWLYIYYCVWRSLGQRYFSCKSHWWEQDFGKLPRWFLYFPKRRMNNKTVPETTHQRFPVPFSKNAHISICQCSRKLTTNYILGTFALVFDGIDFQRELAKALNFNWAMGVSYIP